MQDERIDGPEPKQERTPWVEPALSRLSAGSAELAIGPSSDGPDFS